MKHKTAELSGALLDAAVAKAEGLRFIIESWMTDPPKPGACWLLEEGQERPRFPATPYQPSTDWAVGGLLIERWRLEKLTIERMDDGGWSVLAAARTATVAYAEGPTQLVALMRAWVTMQVGDEVELP